MSRIVIDTNILYSIVGIHENEKVTNSTLLNHKLSITTASVIEVVVKYRNEIDKIKICLKPIIDSKIELISIGHAPVTNDQLKKLYYSESLNEAESTITTLFELKILKEAEFLKFILVIVVLGIFDILRENGYKFSDSKKSSYQTLGIKALIEANEQFFLEYFKDYIAEGYKSGNEQKIVLDAFQTKIINLISIFHFNYHMIKIGAYPRENESADPKLIEELKQSMKDDNFDLIVKKYLDNPIQLIAKKHNDLSFNKYISTIRAGIKDIDSLSTKSTSMIMRKVEKAYKDKSKFRKNDVFDFLIVFSLELPDTQLVTLDKAFATLLKDVDSDSYNLCKSLGLV